ncbi:Membrane insertase YidC [Gossypium arboreum]|uniref:Membrane insertase YidC n=1 Tax=Gossypium arboreum TaxID=29729 RepID=A0A0B0PWR0_GOSAR|nr:Membrane insertase YidC [Gossypium arboreum]
MSLGLPFRSRSYMCCRLTVACMSLPIHQLMFDSSLDSDKVEDTHHTIQLSIGWQSGFANSLFLSTRQRHGRVSPGVEIKIKLVCPCVRPCDPSQRVTQVGHGLGHGHVLPFQMSTWPMT